MSGVRQVVHLLPCMHCTPVHLVPATGVLGIRVTSKDAPVPQPLVGIVDCGASFSAVNWAAARLLGLLDSNGNLKGKKGPDILSLGVDGRPQPYPTTNVSFTFAGASKLVCCHMPRLGCFKQIYKVSLFLLRVRLLGLHLSAAATLLLLRSWMSTPC